MAYSRHGTLLAALALILAACGPGDQGAEMTRVLSPPVAATTPDPTIAPAAGAELSSGDADLLARTELSAVLAAAQEIFAARGTFDADLETVAASTGIDVAALVDAASSDGVVYDAHGLRLTLHRRSASGRWFCVDVTEGGKDYGFGDSFQSAFDACTDGVMVDGWEDTYSATGPDDSAIKTTLAALVDALAAGNGRAARSTFALTASCSVTDLEEVWPAGLALIEPGEFELRTLAVSGERATADVSLGAFTDERWPLVKVGGEWRNDADPCRLVGPVAAEAMDLMAPELLEQGLLAVKGAFVARSNFGFSAAAVAELDGELVLVPGDEVTFGVLSYQGRHGEGLLITRGRPGRFLCAVESLSAPTVYGEGASIDEVDTPGACRSKPS